MRQLLRWVLPLAGTALVLAGALGPSQQFERVMLAAAGCILLIAGNIALPQNLLPNDRRLQALRAELDSFVVAVRRLNAAAIATVEKRSEIATFHAACDDLVQRARHIGTVTAATHGLQPRTIKANPE